MSKQFSPSKEIDLKAELKALLLYEGVSQKEAAQLLKISEKTVSRWVNDPVTGYRQELDNNRLKGVKKQRDMESVPQMAAKIRVNRPDWYPEFKKMVDYVRNPNYKPI